MKKSLSILIASGIAASSAQAALINIDTTVAATLNSTTLSFTVDGANANRMLLVAIAGELGTISGISYDGNGLTQIAAANAAGRASFSEIWVLDDVGAGTSDIVVNLTGGSNGFQFGAISLYSTGDLVISDTDTTSSGGSAAPGSLSLNIAPDAFVFAMGESNNPSNIGTTDLVNNLFSQSTNLAGGWSFSGDYENNPGPGDIDYTWSGNQRHALAGVVVRAIPEPSSTALLGLGGLALILRRRK